MRLTKKHWVSTGIGHHLARPAGIAVLASLCATLAAPQTAASSLEGTAVTAAVTADESAAQEAMLFRAAQEQAIGIRDTSGDGDGGPPPGTKPPKSLGDGTVAGIKNADGSLTFYAKDALLGGFDWFTKLKGWFPSVLHTSAALTPTHQVVDMAYAKEGTMTFKNVVVASTGVYRMTVRYAFASGLFHGIDNRQMGVTVNGADITDAMSFPITGSFSKYQESSIQIPLNAGKNTVQIRAVSDHGVSRVDTITIQ